MALRALRSDTLAERQTWVLPPPDRPAQAYKDNYAKEKGARLSALFRNKAIGSIT